MVTKRKRSGEPNRNGADAASTDRPEPRPAVGARSEASRSVRASSSSASVKAAKPSVANAKVAKPKSAAGPSTGARPGASGRIPQPGVSGRIPRPDASGEISSSDDAEKRIDSSRPQTREVRKPRKRWPLVVIGVVLLVVLACVGAFSWDRWLRYDDAAELQGEWRVSGSTAVIVIDGASIRLTEDVAYAYELDTKAKTISFAFGAMEGQGRYRFSLDRSQLIIMDGEGNTWLSTLLDDIGWLLDKAACAVSGQPQEPVAAADGTTVLDRLSHDASASPREGTLTGAPANGSTASGDGQSADASAGGSAAADASAADAAQDDADADASSSPVTPGGVFDVSDVPA